jgi:hypothetical protein
MTDRPSLAAMEMFLLDERHRLRPERKSLVIKAFVCRRAQQPHRQGLVIKTMFVPLIMWRVEDPQTRGWVWTADWLDALPDSIAVSCPCPRTWLEDLGPFRA